MKKSICLVSGKTDSAVSAVLTKRDFEHIYVHFFLHSPENGRKIVEQTGGGKLYEIDWAPITESLPKHLLKCSLFMFRRIMYKTAEKIAEKENAQAIITGEDLRQGGMEILKKLDPVVEMPVIRPIIPFQKKEIQKLANKHNINPGIMLDFPYTGKRIPPEKTAEKIEKRMKIDIEEIIKKARVSEI